MGDLVRYAGIFGSIARGDPHPNDCDFFVMLDDTANTQRRAEMRSALRELHSHFFNVWGLPLHTTVLTVVEADESVDFMREILAGALIDVRGHLGGLVKKVDANSL